MTTADMPDPTTLVDLDRYPLTDLDGAAGQALVDHCRETLATEGMCRLEAFVTPEATRAFAAEAAALEPHAYYGLTEASPYFRPPDPSLPADHPWNTTTPRCLGLVPYDLFPENTGLQALYDWQPMIRFLAGTLDIGRLYPMADPYQAVGVSVMPEGPGHNWHFDENDFSVTLMLRKPAAGGAFECVAKIRTETGENYPEVQRVLQGARDRVRIVPFEPGTLMIFRGHHALHRVSPVEGPQARLIGTFFYHTEPGYWGTLETTAQVYGPRILELERDGNLDRPGHGAAGR